jgi:hypothetical protein
MLELSELVISSKGGKELTPSDDALLVREWEAVIDEDSPVEPEGSKEGRPRVVVSLVRGASLGQGCREGVEPDWLLEPATELIWDEGQGSGDDRDDPRQWWDEVAVRAVTRARARGEARGVADDLWTPETERRARRNPRAQPPRALPCWTPGVPKTQRPISTQEFQDASVDDPTLLALQQLVNDLPLRPEPGERVRKWLESVKDLVVRDTDGVWKVPRTERDGRTYTTVLVPERLRTRVMELAHDHYLGGHRNAAATDRIVREKFDWPGRNRDVEEFCHACQDCQEANHLRTAPVTFKYPTPAEPFQVMSADLTGELGKVPAGNRTFARHVLVVVDHLTRFPFLCPVLHPRADEIVRQFHGKVIPVTGVPRVLVVDQGSEFMGKAFLDYADAMGMSVLPVPQGAKKSNGMAERAIQTFHGLMRRWVGVRGRSFKDVRSLIPFAELAMRASQAEALANRSPSQVLMGIQLRTPAGHDLGDVANGVLGRNDRWQEARNESRQLAYEATELQRQRQAEASARMNYNFGVGDLVRRKVPFNPKRVGLESYVGATSKWFREFMEEYRIIRVAGEGRYLCQRTFPPTPPNKPPVERILDGHALKRAYPVRDSNPTKAGAPEPPPAP